MKLVDSFGRVHNYLRISLTERCNFRCLYCMPAEGVPLSPDSHILTHSEISRLAERFVDHGVDKIRLTGGEPTVRKDFMPIVESLGSLPGLNQLAITTNGLTLSRKLNDLKRYGLTGVNVSLDTLVEAKFNFFTRRQGFQRVLSSIHEAVAAGIPNVKVNCVVMRGQNDEEVADFVALTRYLPIQVRFIEYMPFDGNKWQQRKMISYLEIRDRITAAGYSLDRISHLPGETSKNFGVTDLHGQCHAGTVGFITSMTSNFCGTCNRLRITADGNLKVCLFGNEEVSLRDMLRRGASEAEMETVVEAALHNKKREHAGMNELKDMKNRPMILIGG